jgi:hypothetical protein
VDDETVIVQTESDVGSTLGNQPVVNSEHHGVYDARTDNAVDIDPMRRPEIEPIEGKDARKERKGARHKHYDKKPTTQHRIIHGIASSAVEIV